MVNYLIKEETLTNIADAIRARKGTSKPIAADDFAEEIADISGGDTYRPLTAMCFNVQRWGQSAGGGSGNYNCVNEIFEKYKPDIVGFQEYWNDDSYCFPSNPDVNVKNYLQSKWEHLYITSQTLANGLPQFTKAIVSNFESQTNEEVRYNNTYSSEGRSYQKIKINFYGKEIAVYNTHLDYYPLAKNATDTAARYLQAKQLFDAVANDEYFIIIGDFNTLCTSTSDKDYQMIIKQFVDAGYNVANNNDIFGFNTTWTEGNPATDEQTDNIITSSNISIESITIDQTKLNYATPYDHLPLVATLMVKMPNDTHEYIKVESADDLPDEKKDETLAITMNEDEIQSIETLSTKLPSGSRCIAAASVGSKIYLFGGVGLKTINVFDTTTNSIHTLPVTLPSNMDDMLAIPVGTKIYILGCYWSTNAICKFDTETEQLTTLGCTMYNTYAASGAAIGDKIYVFGGWTEGDYKISILDTTRETFTTLESKLPAYGLHGATAQAVGDKIYVFGGHGHYQGETSSYLFDTIYEVNIVNETTVNFTLLSAKLPIAANQMGSAKIGDNIYLFGGQMKSSPDTPIDSIYKFNTKDKTLETADVVLPAAARSMGTASVGNHVYLFGGKSTANAKMSTINMFTADPLITLQRAYLRRNGEWLTIL